MGGSVAASDSKGQYAMGVPEHGAVLHVQAPGFASLREPAPKKGPADVELSIGSATGAAIQPVLRLLFASEVTEQGKVRALRLHLDKGASAALGQESNEPALIDPREGHELEFAGPVRVRLSVTVRGTPKPFFEQTLDLSGTRSLTIR